MSIFDFLSETIDLRSFSNIWFWIVALALWMRASNVVMGVPLDLLNRARRDPDAHGADVIDLARIRALRLGADWGVTGVIAVAALSFAATMLLVLGFVYGVEFAQALVFILLPIVVLQLMEMQMARRLQAEDPGLERLLEMLARHRLRALAVVWALMFVTIAWGLGKASVSGAWY